MTNPKEVRIGRHRLVLVAVPGASGHWLLCHPAVMANCPRCLAEPGEPCHAARGHVVLTQREADTALSLVQGSSPFPSHVNRLRAKLQSAEAFRSEPHEERKERWRELGLNNPPGRYGGSAAIDSIRTLRVRLRDACEAAEKLEKKLCEK